jgi:hypothetical protein
VDSYARTPLLESQSPALVPLETLLGRDDARFAAGEEPPWRGRVESLEPGILWPESRPRDATLVPTTAAVA